MPQYSPEEKCKIAIEDLKVELCDLLNKIDLRALRDLLNKVDLRDLLNKDELRDMFCKFYQNVLFFVEDDLRDLPDWDDLAGCDDLHNTGEILVEEDADGWLTIVIRWRRLRRR
jgi:hypothetical protein